MSDVMSEAIPDNYPDLVDRAARLFGDAEAIRDGEVSLSFADIKGLSDECAAALVASGVELRIADDEGRDLPIGQPGEMLVRGHNVMAGYLDNPEATAEAGPDVSTGRLGLA
ncbi:AMP-binding protein [Candidatus Poriferisodalis sp.]|uniref:AMP-binding protein n=1 Tax=Candidatus Poriferisodalis sp. TaxID=3101277 RepID=UPI003B0235A5